MARDSHKQGFARNRKRHGTKNASAACRPMDATQCEIACMFHAADTSPVTFVGSFPCAQVDDLRGSPLSVGTLDEIIDEK